MRRAQQLGRYHLLDRIAFGGMAEIYRAKTFDGHGHAHLVAVKRVLAHLAEDDDFIQMLVDEAKIAGILKHPNIARVYEFARAHGEYFIAMEFVDGKDLRTIMERCRTRKRPLPPQHAAYVGTQLANALHAAHCAVDRQGQSLRIVHRDVSPSNVIASYTGEVKLCDFGIAKATLSKVQTKTGVIKGKVKYMSPEQALGRTLDHRSDIFSLGSCIYEMLTRYPPFTATNEMDLLIKVRDAKYRPVSDIVPNVPREIEAICDRCLARSRAHRYQTAHDVAVDLQGFLSRYQPNYSRSHLGRYVRKMFSSEIEKELRMLEEYVLDERVSDDVGENLIANELGPKAEYTEFTPYPTDLHEADDIPVVGNERLAEPPRAGAPNAMPRREAPPAGAPRTPAPARARARTSQPEMNNDARPEYRPSRRSEPVREDPASAFDIHSADTLILPRRRGKRGRNGNPPSQRELPDISSSAEIDPALHNAPTMILDQPRRKKS